MDRIEDINPQRLQWCLADRGVTLEQCAEEAGISSKTLDKVMAGTPALTFGQLSKLAAYFGRGVLFFLEQEDVTADAVHTPQFRTLANQKPELTPRLKAFIERVENVRAVYLGLLEDADQDDVSRFDPPELTGLNPAAAGRRVRDWLSLGERNDFDSYRHAVEARGLLVMRSNGYNGQWQIAKESPILGFSLYHPLCPVIVVKKLAYEPRQVFTLMHELGHLLLHRVSRIDDGEDFAAQDGEEQEANAFAGALLVPDEFLHGIDMRAAPRAVEELDDWLRPQCRTWGVSPEVILRRLVDAKRFSRTAYVDYRAWRENLGAETADEGGSRMYRHREPVHIFGDRFVRTVLTALSARRITLTKASKYLDNLNIENIHQLERFYAGV